MNLHAASSAVTDTSNANILPYIDSIERLDNHGQAGLSYDQLAGLVRQQQEMLDRRQPYGRGPTIGTASRPQLSNLRTPMQDHPNQRAYDLTRPAAQQLTSQLQGSSSSADPMGGTDTTLPDSAHAKLTKALKRNANQVPLPKFNGKPTTWHNFKDEFVEYYTAKGW